MEGTPARMCLACRRRSAKTSLVRLACERAAVVVDPEARMPGRGTYVCGAQECLDKVLRHAGAALRKALRRTDLHIDEQSLRAAWEQAVRTRAVRGRSPAVSEAQVRGGSSSAVSEAQVRGGSSSAVSEAQVRGGSSLRSEA